MSILKCGLQSVASRFFSPPLHCTPSSYYYYFNHILLWTFFLHYSLICLPGDCQVQVQPSCDSRSGIPSVQKPAWNGEQIADVRNKWELATLAPPFPLNKLSKRHPLRLHIQRELGEGHVTSRLAWKSCRCSGQPLFPTRHVVAAPPVPLGPTPGRRTSVLL